MKSKNVKTKLLFMLPIAVVAWAGVVLQFYLVTDTWAALGISSIEGTIRFFTYFTILTNIIVALSLTGVLLKPKSRLGIFFSGNDTQTAITVYIFIVGLVYNLILRKLWAPQGLQLIVDNILHSLVPFLYIIYWMVFVPKENMKWSKAFNWLAYPAIYFVWVLIFGALSRFYPYPFIDVNVLGYPKMFLHATAIMIVFLVAGFIAITIKKPGGKNIAANSQL